MFDFPFGMYSLARLYLCCTALSAAVAVQQFWNEDEFCQKLNSQYVDQSLYSGATNVIDTNITCVPFNDSQPNRDDTKFLINVRILCREFDSLTYTWDDNMTSDIVIIVEFMSYKTTNMHIINETNLSYISFNNLNSNVEYVARFRTLINGTTNHTTDTPVQVTLNKTHTPDPVKEVGISDFDTTENPNLKTLLTWEPSVDMNCHYKIIYQSDSMEVERRFVEVTKSFAVELTDLKSDTKYSLSVLSYYDQNSIIMSSNRTSLEFFTPTCLEVNKNDVESCPPGRPYDVTVTETRTTGADRRLYDARVSWTIPDGGRGVAYTVVRLHRHAANVSGATAAARFDGVPLPDHYLVSVQAFSRAGRGSAETVVHPRRTRDDGLPAGDGYPRSTAAAAAATVPLTAVALCAVVAAVARARARQRRRRRRPAADAPTARDVTAALLAGGGPLREAVDALLDRDDVVVSDELLGRGHFGVVRKGALRTDRGDRPVAVKSLREHAAVREAEQFVAEILLMHKVGAHPNIVAMVGCCLDANARCLLVVEYCPLGDLQTYLRRVVLKSWHANDLYVDQTDSSGETTADNNEVKSLDTRHSLLTTTAVMTSPMVFNNCYLYHSEENVFLTIDDLMLFASQAANGMAFLEKNRIVHRDLAARNLLLSDHQTVKICDFGLSRDVYEQNHYQKSNCGDPLPVKWMALESLKYRIYTTQSDVWSFGVLLWEIMMLGASPYPTISSSKIYEVLIKGYRMPRPTLCCYSLYEIMLACWNPNPANRPKFDSIKDMIDSIIENQFS